MCHKINPVYCLLAAAIVVIIYFETGKCNALQSERQIVGENVLQGYYQRNYGISINQPVVVIVRNTRISACTNYVLVTKKTRTNLGFFFSVHHHNNGNCLHPVIYMEEMVKEKNVVNNVDKSSLWAP